MSHHYDKLALSHGWLSTVNLKSKRHVYDGKELITMTNQQFADLTVVREIDSSGRKIMSVQRLSIRILLDFSLLLLLLLLLIFLAALSNDQQQCDGDYLHTVDYHSIVIHTNWCEKERGGVKGGGESRGGEKFHKECWNERLISRQEFASWFASQSYWNFKSSRDSVWRKLRFKLADAFRVEWMLM